ncbi:hypothetical protein pb186bvf_003928 [Paramecium bursaria]
MMNINYLERNKKFLIVSILGLGVSAGLYHWWDLITKFNYVLQLLKEPSKEELEQAWQGFQYDPQNINEYQIKEVFQRSLKLYFKVVQDGTQIMKYSRRKYNQNQIFQLSDIVDEIVSKEYIAGKMTNLFLRFKNHSYEDFLASIKIQKTTYEKIKKLSQKQMELTYYCTDSLVSQLFTINKFYEYLKKLVPILDEIKPQLDRAVRFVEQNNFQQYRQIILILHLEDIIYKKLQFEFSIFTMTLENLKVHRVKIIIRIGSFKYKRRFITTTTDIIQFYQIILRMIIIEYYQGYFYRNLTIIYHSFYFIIVLNINLIFIQFSFQFLQFQNFLKYDAQPRLRKSIMGSISVIGKNLSTNLDKYYISMGFERWIAAVGNLKQIWSFAWREILFQTSQQLANP